MFWGIMLATGGLLLIINKVTSFQIPIFQACAGVALFYWGISILLGSFQIELKPKLTESAAVFTKGWFEHPKDGTEKEYSVVFGNGVVDLRDVDLTNGDVEVEVNSVFGQTFVLVSPNTPVVIQSATVFGHTDLPDDNSFVIGKQKYKSPGAPAAHNLIIKTKVVFGNLKITEDPDAVAHFKNSGAAVHQ
jgi:hypothetical protein